jgi:hypothetical protein
VNKDDANLQKTVRIKKRPKQGRERVCKSGHA